MTTTCPRHNNVMQFLEVSKNCGVTWLESSTFWKKSYFNFALNVFFFKKEVKGAILLKIIGVASGVAQGPGLLNRNATNDKFDKKALFLHFKFLLASLRTTVHAYNSN